MDKASEHIVWIPTGLAADRLGCCSNTLLNKYAGSLRSIRLPGGSRKWCMEDVQRLARELRE